MYERIKASLGNPEELEKLYRENRKAFTTAFEKLYPEIATSEPAVFWKTRLDYEKKPDALIAISKSEVIILFIVSLITAFLIKIPDLFGYGPHDEAFYMKNTALIVFGGLTMYTAWINGFIEPKKIIPVVVAFLIAALYVNILPFENRADSVDLVYIHLPLLLWFIYGIVYSGYDFKNLNKRIEFIRYNGDMAIVYVIIAIAGGILTAITLGLFQSIGLKIQQFYMTYVVMTGAAVAPIIVSFLIGKFPALVNKTAQVIAIIFSPLVLVTLVIFLISMAVTGKDPYNDRQFLLVFNLMLLGVMAIIIFSVSETSMLKNQKFSTLILFALSIVTIIVDSIALSAIFYRLGEYGLTPNRLAVLVSNIIVLVNLVLIMADLFRISFRNREFNKVENTVSKYLPVYLLWILIVIFLFPVMFGIK